MARTRSVRHRRRRGRFNAVLKFLCVFLVIAAVIAAMTLFFRIESIVVSGNERYSGEEIIAASGIEIEDNMFLMDKYAVTAAIFHELPYVEEATLHRKLPDTILLEIHEGGCSAAVITKDGPWLISDKGKLLEKTYEIPEDCTVVTGAELLEPECGGMAKLDTESTFKETALLEFLQFAEEWGMRKDILSVELDDDTCLRFRYTGRFDVRMPWDADIDYKLQSLAAVVDYLEVNETGEINLMTDGKASFIPAA